MSSIRTILVVDDEVGVRCSLKAILEPHFKVVACADGPQAIRFASDHRGEVYAAFVDHGMPDMDGGQVCSALRSLDATISLVGFTGNDEAMFIEPLFAKLLKKNASPEHILSLAVMAVQSADRSRIEIVRSAKDCGAQPRSKNS